MPNLTLIEGIEAIAPAALVSLLLLAGLLSGAVPALRFRRPPAAPEPAWSGTDVVAIALLYAGVSLVAAAAFAGLGRGDPPALSDVQAGFLAQLVVHVATVGTIVVVVCRGRGQSFAALGLRRTSVRNVFPVVLLLVFAMVPLQLLHVAWVLVLAAWRGRTPTDQEPVTVFREVLGEGPAIDVALLVVMAVVLAPVTEELLFRSVLFRRLRVQTGFWGAALLSAFLFALVHASEGVLLPILGVGILLAFVYESTGSILTAILFHALFNSGQLVQLALAR